MCYERISMSCRIYWYHCYHLKLWKEDLKGCILIFLLVMKSSMLNFMCYEVRLYVIPLFWCICRYVFHKRHVEEFYE